MKLEQAHIDQIRIAFDKMQSREDLLHLLNEAKPLVFGEKTVPFQLKQLTWYVNPKLCGKRYSEFKIKKKSGSARSINAPVSGLKALQKTLSFILQCVFEPHKAAMGFVRGKSIVDNARKHEGSRYVYNIDLKDFFSSIDQARVWKCLQLKPFNLIKSSATEPEYMKWEYFKKEYLKTDEPVNLLKGKGRLFANTPYGTLYVANNFDKEKDKFVLLGGSSLKSKAGKSLEGTLWLVNKIPVTNRLDIANIIASLCCTEMDVERKNEAGEWETVKHNVLPQGAPTSPVLTNVICQRLDFILSGVAKRFGLKYSRYADDITFSSMHNVYQPESDFLKELHRVITEQGFHIKESKTRLQKDGHRKEVTGLLVNENVNVQQRYIKQLRLWLYYWERYGYKRAYNFFLQQYLVDKVNGVKGKPDMANVIAGKLDYLKMVKGSDNKLFINLRNRFAICLGKELDLTFTRDVLVGNKKNQLSAVLNRALEKHNQLIDEERSVEDEKNKYKVKTLKLEEKSLKEFHNPKRLSELLNQFTLDGFSLKYSTHPLEKSFQFDNFDSFVSSFHEEQLKELKQLNSDLWNYLIYPFLFQEDDEIRLDKDKNLISTFYWGDDKLKLGWKYKKILKEMFEKQQKLGYIEFPLSTKIDKQFVPANRINGKFLTTWNDFVEIFKNEIEFRYNKFETLIISITDPLRTNFNNNIEIIGLAGLNFYTYTSNIKKALSLLITPYNSYANAKSPNLIIKGEYKKSENVIILKIINEGSYWDAILDESNDKVNLLSGKGQLKSIKELLYGLCDWSLESRFRVGDDYKFCRFNYLGKKYKEQPKEVDIAPIPGHTHILTFYL